MKNLTIIGILAASSLLTGCRSAINKVRNGYLESNQTTTIGQALEHTFSNGKWKSFTTEKGVTIVEFDGSHPFGKLYDPSIGESSCTGSLVCAALLNKIENDCKSNSDALDFQNAHDNLALQISEVEKQMDDLRMQGINDSRWDESSKKRLQLWGQLGTLRDPKPACVDNAYKQNADKPIPLAVQFSINSDGTFQYEANDFSWSQEKLFYNMYK